MAKSLLIIVDPQNDFVSPEGSLFVPGSEEMIENVCQFIANHGNELADIVVTQDSHHAYHVGHQCYWQETHELFSQISATDIETGKATPINPQHKERTLQGARLLGNITIWPQHCVQGTWGWCFPEKLNQVLAQWEISRGGHHWIREEKGFDATYEAYSIFTEQKITGKPSCASWRSCDYDKIYIAGVAKDVCVANTVNDMMNFPKYYGKLVFLNSALATLNPQSPMLKVYDTACSNFGATML